ncbi:MAG: hypothetical protein ACOZCL_02525 [Bacillota bacterium]
MKLIELKKTTALSVLLVFLIFLFFSLNRIFVPIAEAFVNNHELLKLNRQEYREYSALGGNFKFSLPDSWQTRVEHFGGKEIIYNMFFNSQDSKIHGFIQVWNLNKPLKQFLEESKKSSVGAVDFKYYKMKEIMPGKKRGYLIEYSRAVGDGRYIKAYEVFIEGDSNAMYRASFFSDEDDWKSYYPVLFNRIVRSFVIEQTQ